MSDLQPDPQDRSETEVAVRFTTVEFPLPGTLREKGERWLGDPQVVETAPEVRPAATVMLVRDHDQGRRACGVEVFVMRRVTTMAFAPDVTVFPGGGVDARDDEPTLPWLGPDPAHWARLLGVDERLARRLVVAAAREVFEECGVLLAASSDGVGNDRKGRGHLTDSDWQAQRDALVRREIAFAQLLEERGLALRTDLLRARARWVTPEFETRRYDTFFFVARVPSGQMPDGRSTEAATAGWERPADLLSQSAAEEIILLPPTQYQARTLAGEPDVATLMEQEPTHVPLPRIMPLLTRRGEEYVLVCEVPA